MQSTYPFRDPVSQAEEEAKQRQWISQKITDHLQDLLSISKPFDCEHLQQTRSDSQGKASAVTLDVLSCLIQMLRVHAEGQSGVFGSHPG